MTREKAIDLLDNLIGMVEDNQESDYDTALKMGKQALSQEPKSGWNNHQIACMLADLFGDVCACNYNGIDEWLPELCDFKDTCCPKPIGVACWEQFLKYIKSKYCECEEPCDDAISRQAVLDTLNTSDKFMDEDRTFENYKALLKECYKVLPSVTQKSGKCLNKDDFIYALKTCGFSVHRGKVMYAEDDLIQRFDELAESEE